MQAPFEWSVPGETLPGQDLAPLADKLGVSLDALAALKVQRVWATTLQRWHAGFHGKKGQGPRPDAAWAIPERDGQGAIVGASLRADDGGKGAASRKAGARRGLTYADPLPAEGTIWVVEGMSDVAAMLTLGLVAVGRPSNVGGAAELAELLQPHAERVVVVGENDGPRPDGSWPGREGALQVARKLAEAWDRPVRWTMPPVDAKDIRAWLGTGTGVELAATLEAAAETVQPAQKLLAGASAPTSGLPPSAPEAVGAPAIFPESVPAEVASALAAVSALERGTWLKMGQALHSTREPWARSAWDAWSKTCPKKFNAADQEKTWRGFRPRANDVGIRSLFHLAYQHGWAGWTPEPAPHELNGTSLAPPEDGWLLSVEQVLSRVPPPWLIEPFTRQGALVVLYGPSGSYKSFVVLGLAWSIASGSSWCGFPPSSSGPVIYVAGEGLGGLGKRFIAQIEAAGTGESPPFWVVTEPIHLMDARSVKNAIERLRHLAPRLVVFDTLAMCLAGGDENSAKDVGLAISNLRLISRELGGCTVLVVHHAGKDLTKGERGSSSLRGAADVMWVAEREEGSDSVLLSCSKAKDDERPEPFRLRKKQTAESLVLVRVGKQAPLGENPAAQMLVLHAFHDWVDPVDGVTAATLVTETHLSKASVHRALNELEAAGTVERRGKAGHTSCWCLSESNTIDTTQQNSPGATEDAVSESVQSAVSSAVSRGDLHETADLESTKNGPGGTENAVCRQSHGSLTPQSHPQSHTIVGGKKKVAGGTKKAQSHETAAQSHGQKSAVSPTPPLKGGPEVSGKRAQRDSAKKQEKKTRKKPAKPEDQGPCNDPR